MKHNVKITIIILSMFLLSQFIGLHVVNNYANERVVDGIITNVEDRILLPYGMDSVDDYEKDYETTFASILLSFIIAVGIIFLLMRIKAKLIMRTWFFLVTILALAIALNAILPLTQYLMWISLAIAIPVAFLKIYKRDILVHNISELLIYPGIAAVFVPLLNLKTGLILLVVISLYDAWAVWKSKIMQKMAKFQMDELKVFSGFFIPYVGKKEGLKIRKLKMKIKEKKITKSEAMKKGIKVNVAILGGGDVVFPIIISGIMLKTWGIFPAIAVIFGALLGLGMLLFFSEKKKFYPAMPFISAGIFLAIGISWLLI